MLKPGIFAKHEFKARWVVGPLGEPLTLETLPSSGLKRWAPLRKAEVVSAVEEDCSAWTRRAIDTGIQSKSW